jgi:hypothetical protein
VNGSGAGSESLEGGDALLVGFKVIDQRLRQWADFAGDLAIEQVDREAFWVVEGDAVAAAGG